ncbi:MAG TPA: sigma-70 family RNA polymerase sigma factor [Gaiellaceae bacterium]|jgi:RNA polymerase sigma-B factor|nr:sigma-70 family RNA polymerase sigma factor [Gaiellaceae bacterium]
MDRKRRAQLAERYLPLARSAAARHAHTRELREELTQVGALGLVAAASRFDPSRHVPFAAYAGVTVEGEIRRYLRDRSSVVRVPRRERAIARPAAPVPLSEAERRPNVAAADELDGCERRALLRRGLEALPPREREAIGLCYLGGLTQREAASRMRISQSQTSRLLAAGLERLRQKLAEAELA